MRMPFVILALAGAAVAMAQTPPRAEPAVPMVPTITPPLGAASRASRHELFARERERRVEEKAEDRADAQQKRKASERALRRMER
ncbi:MAG: hypothetical protein JWQ33_633 [Ramlibacter sp.]|nr:hypothetical protein [Ramlibacter sp.]